MKPSLIMNYKDPLLKHAAISILNNLLLKNKKTPLLVVIESYAIHFFPWTDIVFNPKVMSGWKAVLEKYWKTESYRKLNEAIKGDPLLAKYATINFLNRLMDVAEKHVRANNLPKSKDPINAVSEYIENLMNSKADEAEKMVSAFASELESEAEEIVKDIEAAKNFTHVGVPVEEYLDKPEEFRMIARNNIIVSLVKMLRRIRSEAPSLKRTAAPTLVGGRPLGVKRIQRYSELPHTLPQELLDDDLLGYKMVSRSLMVREKRGSSLNYTIYIDKSGSMDDTIIYESASAREYVPKISFATACALALAEKLRASGSKLTLKFFDTEVHEPVGDFKKLVDLLLRIRASGGTNISKVLEDAVENHGEDRIIVITDGIDNVDPEIVKRAKAKSLDIAFVFINTKNELLEKNFEHVHIERARPDVILSL